jgi:hypothetical protein
MGHPRLFLAGREARATAEADSPAGNDRKKGSGTGKLQRQKPIPAGMTTVKSKGDGSLGFVCPTLSDIRKGWGTLVCFWVEEGKGNDRSRFP